MELKKTQKCQGTICHHYYHKRCLKKWVNDNWTCPICRLFLYKKKYINIEYNNINKLNNEKSNENTI